MDSAADTLAGGFPHSETPGSQPARGSPGLVAACHVLHRLLAPRHPPDALPFPRPRPAATAPRGAPPPPEGPKRQHTHNTRARPQAYPCRTDCRRARRRKDRKEEEGAAAFRLLASARPRATRGGGTRLVAPFSSRAR